MTDVKNISSIGTCTLVDFSEFHVICICTRHVREHILPLQLKHFKVMKHQLKKVSSFYNSFIRICSDKWRLKRWEQGGINQGQFLKVQTNVLHVNQFNSNQFLCTCWHISWRKTHTIFFFLWRTYLNLCSPYPMAAWWNYHLGASSES